jgi:hypothetical protein
VGIPNNSASTVTRLSLDLLTYSMEQSPS